MNFNIQKFIQVSFLIIFCHNLSFSQGTNNPYDYDRKDLNNIFKERGIYVFKFPFELKKDEYISISYEIYEDRKLIKRVDQVEDLQIRNKTETTYHLSYKDTTYFHRFYFFEKEDKIKIQTEIPGLNLTRFELIPESLHADFYSVENVPERLNKRQLLLYYYGKKKNTDRKHMTLYCPEGMSPGQLVKKYDFVILFYAERIDKERAKHILEEDFYKNIK